MSHNYDDDDSNDSVPTAADGDDDDAITGLFGEVHQSGRKETSLARFGIFPRSLENIFGMFLRSLGNIVSQVIGKYYIQLLESCYF